MNRKLVDIDENIRASVIELDGGYEIAVLVRRYQHLSPDDWEIDYSVFSDVIRVGTEMEVYGALEEIREAYL